ncbi:FeoA family protein [Pontibacter sp. G13]|uniref:FeoA family protein n=1 Tax=Pontibacter sp. G13 TaxID=3074898 RepID=UPI00288BFFED|nr:FeoA family protein [Pontibacter sp. G13]WNJ17086.1 FeoA family protein [Pontibacter sp. G13]
MSHQNNQASATEIPLSQLAIGQKGQIARILHAELEAAFLRMGLTQGDQLTLSAIAPLGDPIAIRVNRTKVSLRKKDAQHIWISLQ